MINHNLIANSGYLSGTFLRLALTLMFKYPQVLPRQQKMPLVSLKLRREGAIHVMRSTIIHQEHNNTKSKFRSI